MERAWELWMESFPLLLTATVKVTIPITLVSFVFALILGTLTALVRFGRVPVLSQLGLIYVWMFRGTPLLVQLFIVFYGLPKIGIVFDAWPAAIITLSLNTGAYASEAIRASISSIPKGQWEAAQALNLTGPQIFGKVIAPQAYRIALPPLGNDFIDLVKGTSLLSVVTITELFLTGQQIAVRVYEPLAMYLQVAFIYLMISTALTALQGWLEKRTSVFIAK